MVEFQDLVGVAIVAVSKKLDVNNPPYLPPYSKYVVHYDLVKTLPLFLTSVIDKMSKIEEEL